MELLKNLILSITALGIVAVLAGITLGAVIITGYIIAALFILAILYIVYEEIRNKYFTK